MKTKMGQEALSWLQILLGLTLSVCAYRMYLIPNEIAPGGFTGIGQLVNSFTGWPIGMISLALNIPLFAFSMKKMGVLFGVKSLVASISFSLLLDALVSLPRITAEPLLAAVFGGLFAGFGFGLILRGGATTGGTDMLGMLISRHIPILKVGVLTFTIDAMVIVASGFVFGATSAMLALIVAFLFGKTLDLVLEGPNLAKAYYIISDKNELIADRILNVMGRGVTGLHGKGMYSGQDKLVLLCVINRTEVIRLRNIVASIDKNAFVIATDAQEVLGEGFKPHVKI